jgi:hypothetical protein
MQLRLIGSQLFVSTSKMLRRIFPLSRTIPPLLRPSQITFLRPFSSSLPCLTDPFPSVFEDVSSPLEITSVLRSGKGFKIRTLQEPEPHTIHGNLIVLDGEYFLWRPQIKVPQAGVLDIAPEAWGIFDVITPKPGTDLPYWVNRLIEILVLGTGDRILFMQRAREALEKLGIQVDIQDTVLPSGTLLMEEKCRKLVQSAPGGGEKCCCCALSPRIRRQSHEKYDLGMSRGIHRAWISVALTCT